MISHAETQINLVHEPPTTPSTSRVRGAYSALTPPLTNSGSVSPSRPSRRHWTTIKVVQGKLGGCCPACCTLISIGWHLLAIQKSRQILGRKKKIGKLHPRLPAGKSSVLWKPQPYTKLFGQIAGLKPLLRIFLLQKQSELSGTVASSCVSQSRFYT